MKLTNVDVVEQLDRLHRATVACADVIQMIQVECPHDYIAELDSSPPLLS